MRIRLVVDGREHDLEVDPAAGTVRLDGKTIPFTLEDRKGERTRLELAGEAYELLGTLGEGGSEELSLVVNREVHTVRLLSRETVPGSRVPSSLPPVAPAPAAPAPGQAMLTGGGLPVLPPMPGKVLEVLVEEGAPVKAGQVLVVLEAMKMRNELASPKAGRVRGLAVRPGQTVKARDVLLTLVPDAVEGNAAPEHTT
jgi:biotin carboxyl carrier protein